MFKNPLDSARGEQAGLAYSGNEIVGDLVNKDTDLDGVLDWEEGLWGTDPTKKDTNDDGTPDNVEISAQGGPASGGEKTGQDEENLTETDKFSRELFATIATLNQSGEMDQATVDKISSSLAENLQNSVPKKVFTISDIKVIKDTTVQAIKNYDNALESIRKKYPINKSVTSILQEFIIDEDNVNASTLAELDPIIKQMTQIIDAIAKTNVPQTLSVLHLDLINGFQRLVENISDIKLYDSDTIVALSAISQYEKNVSALESTVSNLSNTINQKLSN